MRRNSINVPICRAGNRTTASHLMRVRWSARPFPCSKPIPRPEGWSEWEQINVNLLSIRRKPYCQCLPAAPFIFSTVRAAASPSIPTSTGVISAMSRIGNTTPGMRDSMGRMI